MPSTSIGGCAIPYEIFGSGVPVVITGGGREPMADAIPFAEKLAETRQVILWDRACIGAADAQLEGPRDLDLWSTQLAALLDRLGVGPAYLLGPSNGARVALVTALRYPDVVKGLFMFLITGGGERGARGIATTYRLTAEAAETGGMDAVIAMPAWAERIAANPANRGLLLSMNAEDVARTMRRWERAFDPTSTILGISDHDLGRIKAPAHVIDMTEVTGPFKRYNKELADLLPNARLIQDDQAQAEWVQINETYGVGSGHYTGAMRLVDLLNAFIDENEALA